MFIFEYGRVVSDGGDVIVGLDWIGLDPELMDLCWFWR